MGCGASAPPEYCTEITAPVNAFEVYEVADHPRPEHKMPHGKHTRIDRDKMLGEIFEACDDDKNGILDLNEYTKIFKSGKFKAGENDDEEMYMTESFLDMIFTGARDGVNDGRVDKEDFVKWWVAAPLPIRLGPRPSLTFLLDTQAQREDGVCKRSDVHDERQTNAGASTAIFEDQLEPVHQRIHESRSRGRAGIRSASARSRRSKET